MAAVPITLVALSVILGATILRPGRGLAQAQGPTTTGSPPMGQTVYLRDCAVCHGADAAGTNQGPSLQGVGAASVDYWVSSGRMPLVSNGRNPPSPYQQTPPGQLLANPDAQAHRHTPAYPPDVTATVVGYVTTIAPGGPDVPSLDLRGAKLAAGGEVFRLQCAACHSWDGTGGALYGRQAPALHASTPTQIAEAVRTGPGQMPAFGTSAVPPDQLANLVAYVRYLDKPTDRGGAGLWHLGPVAEGGVAIIGGLGALLLISRWIGERT